MPKMVVYCWEINIIGSMEVTFIAGRDVCVMVGKVGLLSPELKAMKQRAKSKDLRKRSRRRKPVQNTLRGPAFILIS